MRRMPPATDPTIVLTEKSLTGMGGWQIWKQARAIHEGGHVTEATYEPPLLKGRVSEGGKEFLAASASTTASTSTTCAPAATPAFAF